MSNTVKTINPFTEQVLDEFQLLSLEEANAAVDKSHEAFLSWRKTRGTGIKLGQHNSRK